MALPIDASFTAGQRAGAAGHVQFEIPRNHDHRLWPISILCADEAERSITTHEQSAANSLLISNHPVAPSVLTDRENRRAEPRGRFGLLSLFHCHSPFRFFCSRGTGASVGDIALFHA